MRCSSPPPTPITGHSNTYRLIHGYIVLRINCNKGSGWYIKSSVDHLLSSLCVFAHNSNMNYRQLTKVLLLLSCFISHAFAGLLPGGNTGGSGYQYNRPGGTGFGGVPGTFTGGDLGRGSDFGGGFKRPTTLYGAPGSGGDIGFGGRPSTAYGIPGQFGGGGGGSGSYQDAGYGQDNGRPQPYSFQYEVYDPPSGNDYSQRESSDGNVVQGEYRVLLPDSRTQIVKYMADDANGYTADVQYEGQAQFSRGGIGSGAYGTPGQTGAGGYQGDAGVFGGTSGQFGGPTASNQYLPPRNNYRK
ncbi:pro-resilin-like [Apis laboriosa]|uniref:pro-resilin-like n=1 Tax=Apis laboriosa TaxID=183418 RepID=UPI001CC7E3D3|nr:pro-resilin-like [Apis laboriosa]